jgi:hypothetical protein
MVAMRGGPTGAEWREPSRIDHSKTWRACASGAVGDLIVIESLSSRDHHERVEAERNRQRRLLTRSETLLTFVLLLSTLFAWENFPVIIPGPAPPGQFVGGGDRIGLLTMPAGPLVILLALSALVWWPRMTRGRTSAGWLSLARAMVIFVVISTEISQLILGRRNWEDHHATIFDPAYANAVGTGVWLALGAAVGLVIVSLVYLTRVYATWRYVPEAT